MKKFSYRLQLDRMREFYDVNDEKGRVEVFGFSTNPEAENRLHQHGVQE